jgi:hypothetical protein
MTNEYNRHTGNTGTLWERRFRSTVIERGWPILNCAAYIELNSFRAGLVKQPETYTYSSLHYLTQGNKDNLVDIDLLEEGLGIAAEYEHISKPKLYHRELTKTYAAFIYEAGTKPARDKQGRIKEQGLVITEAMKQRLRKYGLQTEEGTFVKKIWEYSMGKFIGGSEFADRFYEEHINPGYKGKLKEWHTEKWVHGIWNGLWSVYNTIHKGWNLRGSP